MQPCASWRCLEQSLVQGTEERGEPGAGRCIERALPSRHEHDVAEAAARALLIREALDLELGACRQDLGFGLERTLERFAIVARVVMAACEGPHPAHLAVLLSRRNRYEAIARDQPHVEQASISW